MIIQVNDRWRVSSDSLQWVLQRRSVPRSGSKRAGDWSSIAFAKDLSTLLYEMTRRQVFAIEGEYPSSAILLLCEALDVIKADIARVVATIGANDSCPSTTCPMRRRDGAGSAGPDSSATSLPDEAVSASALASTLATSDTEAEWAEGNRRALEASQALAQKIEAARGEPRKPVSEAVQRRVGNWSASKYADRCAAGMAGR